MEKYTAFMDQKNQYSENAYATESNLQIQCNPYQATNGIFHRARTDAFELWCWRRLLRVLWTARRSNQSILEEITPEYSLEVLKLKLQYFGYLM